MLLECFIHRGTNTSNTHGVAFEVDRPNHESGFDADLHCAPAGHLVESLLVILELKDVRDHALDIDLASVQVRDGTRETIRLRERANDLDDVLDDEHTERGTKALP